MVKTRKAPALYFRYFSRQKRQMPLLSSFTRAMSYPYPLSAHLQKPGHLGKNLIPISGL